MADGDDKSEDLYAVLGLKKECTASELRSAYKKLALVRTATPFRGGTPIVVLRRELQSSPKRPRRNSRKFNSLSVLSDVNKRFLYDIGAYDNDDDENGMGDFMSEMAVLMSQAKSNERGQWSFEDLQETFDDMFQREIKMSRHGSHIVDPAASSSSCVGYNESSTSSKKRDFTAMNSSKKEGGWGSDSHFQKKFPEMKKPRDEGNGKKVRDEGKGKKVREERLDAPKHGRKRKVSSGVQLVP